MEYKGIAGSKGIAAGKAYIFKRNQMPEDKIDIAEEDINAEINKLEQGVKVSKIQLLKLRDLVQKGFDKEKAAIFDAHIMMLEDPEFEAKVKDAIESERITAAHAVQKTVEFYVSAFEQIEDEYMRERAADVKDVGGRLIRNLTGAAAQGLEGICGTVILVAHDLAPSDTALIDKRQVLGLVTDVGGGTSHTAIMARSLEIPAVLGLGNISGQIKDGDYIIIDGLEGKVIVAPDELQQAEYRKKADEYEGYKEKLSGQSHLPAITTDGRKVEIAANIGTSSDIEGVLNIGGDGVGLFRTEFLYMNGVSLPTEEEQYLEYKKVSEGLGGKPVIIRTLDIGGDKKLPYLPLPEEMNPFLGWRAIRLCLDRKDIFRAQLRAILRASTGGNILIMFPMISGVSEVREAKRVLEEAKAELRKEKLGFDENVKVGIMVEIPSAAITADTIAKEVDFFSIGTNDLCQYSLAVDRMNPKVSKLYQPLHPAMLHLIKDVIEASHRHGKFTGMCGEMAGSVEAAAILLGLGLDEFSMSSASIPAIKNVVRNISYEKAAAIAEHALTLETPEEVIEFSQDALKQLNIEFV